MTLLLKPLKKALKKKHRKQDLADDFQNLADVFHVLIPAESGFFFIPGRYRAIETG